MLPDRLAGFPVEQNYWATRAGKPIRKA